MSEERTSALQAALEAFDQLSLEEKAMFSEITYHRFIEARRTRLAGDIGVFLTEITDIPDMDIALRKILSEYLELKLKSLDAQTAHFETKWNMTFEDFSQKCEDGQLEADTYAYEVEKDFWEWEEAVTLKKRYETLSVPVVDMLIEHQ
jgi:hypothetical protein